MKQIKKPSTVPVYGFGAVWAVWCLLCPMYKLWHFAVCALLSLAAFFLLKKKFPGETVLVEEPESAPDTGNAELDAMITAQRESLREIRRLNDAIDDAKLSSQMDELETLCSKIFAQVQERPEKLPQIRKMMNYYLPTTLKLLRSYQNLSNQGVRGENIQSAMEKIPKLMDAVLTAFRKQLDCLFETDVVDITADIRVMEQMLKSEGLTDQKDFN